MSQTDRPSGIYPMLYAFFKKNGKLDRAAIRAQVKACIANEAHGLAVLGLATEVAKLTESERHQIVEWVSDDLSGELPLAVTIFGDSIEKQVDFARHARRCGAGWVILQPPRVGAAGDGELVPFFGRVMEKLDMPVAVQNAPEYLGFGLSENGIAALAEQHPNFTVLKGEGPVLQIRSVIEHSGDRLSVFNGRAGLELIDNLRAGCAGIIPGAESFDLQARCFEAMREGDDVLAYTLYAQVLPTIVFVMQSIDHLVCYGKRIAAQRLGIKDVYDRTPGVAPSAFGLDCVRYHAALLGPLR
jgi:4-hydroxy-tetrahydrodipicolinate synthase